MGQNIEREARENIRREVGAYPGTEVQFFRTDKGDAVRAVIRYRGKSSEVRFWRSSNQAHVMRSIISDTRREMRTLGIIDRDKGRAPIRHVGVIGEKLVEAVKKAAPEAFAPPAAPQASEPEPDDDDSGNIVDFDDYLCPDAIAERGAQSKQSLKQPSPKQERTPMTILTPATPHNEPTAQPNGATGHATTTPKNKLTKLETVTLTRLLIVNGIADEAAGLYTYNEGWSDERVHKEIKTKADLKVVSETRRECGFGKLASEMKRAKPLTDTARIEVLEARVAKLEEQLAILVGG